jgi:hypothetical protein
MTIEQDEFIFVEMALRAKHKVGRKDTGDTVPLTWESFSPGKTCMSRY